MNNITKIVIGVVCGLVIGAVLVTTFGGSEAFGSPGTYFPHGLRAGTFFSLDSGTSATSSGSLAIGSSGTPLSKVLFGTCNLFSSGDTIAATSSVIASCSAPGVVAGDKVFVNLATSTAGNNDQYAIVGASASSSADFIAVQLLNLSGGASQTTKAGTSTQYLILR